METRERTKFEKEQKSRFDIIISKDVNVNDVYDEMSKAEYGDTQAKLNLILYNQSVIERKLDIIINFFHIR